MRTFDLLTPQDAVARLNQALDDARSAPPSEEIDAHAARDRVLARDVVAPSPLPEFRRSTVDGYAIQAASSGSPLRVIGEVAMGALSEMRVGPGEAALIHTGGHVPEGADAVAMLEDAAREEQPPRAAIRLAKRLAPGDNLIEPGEDVQAGEAVLRAGTRLREQDIGGLLSFGFTRVEVARRPRVALIASGDEVVPPEAAARPGQVRNINTPMLSALVGRCGGQALDFGILPDRREAFDAAAARAMREADAVVFMAGSSVSERDFTPDVVDGMGQPGILAHGIAFRPGKPTLFAVCDGRPVFGLPGNPVSALVTAMLFVAPVLWRLQGALNPPRPAVVSAALGREVRSPRNLEHWFPVRLARTEIGDWKLGDAPNLQPPISNLSAVPVATKSNLIFSLARADGLACAPIGVDRLAAGERIDVRLLE